MGAVADQSGGGAERGKRRIGLGVTGYISYELLHRNAREEVLRNAGVMMEAALSTRIYTTTKVRAALPYDPDKFLPESVPAFAATEIMTLLRKNYPVAVANRIGEPLDEAQSVVGPLCTPLDLLGERMSLARAEPGDLVVVFQSGAYGITASLQGFLSHPGAAEVLV